MSNPTLELSSLVYTSPQGEPRLVHDSFSDVSVARRLANIIQNNPSQLKKFWFKLWSYQEDSKLWDLDSENKAIWRGALPEWRSHLVNTIQLLDENNAQTLVDLVSRAHESLQQSRSITTYNPFLSDIALANELTRAHPLLRAAKIADLEDQYDWATQILTRIPTRTQAVYAQISPVRQLHWYGYRGQLLASSIDPLQPYMEAHLLASAFTFFGMGFEELDLGLRKTWHHTMETATGSLNQSKGSHSSFNERMDDQIFFYWRDSDRIFGLLSTFCYKDKKILEYTSHGKAEELVERFRKRIERIAPGIFARTEPQFPNLIEYLVRGVITEANEIETRTEPESFSYPWRGFGLKNIPHLYPYQFPDQGLQSLYEFKQEHGLSVSGRELEKLHSLHEYAKPGGLEPGRMQ